MFSVKGDVVLDPFLGTGTTMEACMVAGRNSVGFEIDKGLRNLILAGIEGVMQFGNDYIEARLCRHREFVGSRTAAGKGVKYVNDRFGFPVVSKQESQLLLNRLASVDVVEGNAFMVRYETRSDFCRGSAGKPCPSGRSAQNGTSGSDDALDLSMTAQIP